MSADSNNPTEKIDFQSQRGRELVTVAESIVEQIKFIQPQLKQLYPQGGFQKIKSISQQERFFSEVDAHLSVIKESLEKNLRADSVDDMPVVPRNHIPRAINQVLYDIKKFPEVKGELNDNLNALDIALKSFLPSERHLGK